VAAEGDSSKDGKNTLDWGQFFLQEMLHTLLSCLTGSWAVPV